jgi:hypothetical protein
LVSKNSPANKLQSHNVLPRARKPPVVLPGINHRLLLTNPEKKNKRITADQTVPRARTVGETVHRAAGVMVINPAVRVMGKTGVPAATLINGAGKIPARVKQVKANNGGSSDEFLS